MRLKLCEICGDYWAYSPQKSIYKGEWYIPAIGEMNDLLLNFNFINNASNRQFPSGWFFSATRYEANNQWCVVFSRGQFFPQSKSNGGVGGMAFLSFKKK